MPVRELREDFKRVEVPLRLFIILKKGLSLFRLLVLFNAVANRLDCHAIYSLNRFASAFVWDIGFSVHGHAYVGHSKKIGFV